MLFNSWQYAVFLPIVFALYWLLPHRYRWVLLLAASYYFYMSWNAKYVFLILFTTAASYAAALFMERTDEPRRRKTILALTLAACLGVLGVFKYFNFFFDSLTDLFSIFSLKLQPVTLNLLLPVGISFYTFQTLSYVIDVYRGKVKAEHHFGIYATFISFFPQLVAGPIERTENLLSQIKAEHQFDYAQATQGLRIMIWGLFKKMAIADRMAPHVDKIFDNVHDFSGFALLIAAFLFSVQIYCDFSGYSDIARGSAKLMGIDLMENFKSPYLSASIREFWSRWHISLSTWFRDYVYIPLGGNRVKELRHRLNLLITFLVSGLWHGANWTFVVWGGIHGLAQIAEEKLFPRKHEKPSGFLWCVRVALVFTFVTFAWVFFRAQSLSDALYVLTHLFTGIGNPISYLRTGFKAIDITRPVLVHYGVIYLLPLFMYDLFSLRRDQNAAELLSRKKAVVQWIFYLALGFVIIYFFPKNIAKEFVYFQF